MAKQWIIPPASPDCAPIAQSWGVPPIVAQLLLNRGVSPNQPCELFLSPQLKDLHAPGLLPDANTAAGAIVESIRSHEKIALYGDYDVDGITGVAILWHVLHLAGADVRFYVPHRIEEGYGLNLEASKRLIAEGVQLIVTIDCGITAVEVADEVRGAGAKLIITDHHAFHGKLPRAEAIVHPGVGEGYPNRDLCGAGVAFKLAWAIAQEVSGAERVRPEFRRLLLEMLPLAALGTIADVVPVLDENRIITKHGLKGLISTSLPGLRALMESAGLSENKVTGYDVGFKLAPRINASGRMGHARLAVELFTRADTDRAREIAMYLEEHNRSRQATERRILKQALAMIEDGDLANDARRAIVLAMDGWHAGVIGIVAARIVDRYHRPTVMIALAEGVGQGSGRSIQHFDLEDALAACEEDLISYGGHAMAAGLRIAADRVESFTERFVALANNRLTGDDLVPKLRLDAEVTLDALDLPTAQAIEEIGPFGVGNPKPRLATGWVELADEPRCVGRNGEHLQASFVQQGVRVRAIGFGLASVAEDLKQHRRCQVAFAPIINEFNGRRSVEMQMLDLRFPG
jgi:single-stranded-DNA-specific exonuclease